MSKLCTMPEMVTAEMYRGSASTRPSAGTVKSLPNWAELTLDNVNAVSLELTPVRALLLWSVGTSWDRTGGARTKKIKVANAARLWIGRGWGSCMANTSSRESSGHSIVPDAILVDSENSPGTATA